MTQQDEFGFADDANMPPYDKIYDRLTEFWPMGHLLEGELKARTHKAILVDENWIPWSQIEMHEISKDNKAKLIVSNWFFQKLFNSEQATP